MSLKRQIVGDITKKGTKKGLASALTSALTMPSSANSVSKGKAKQDLTRKPGKK